MTVEELADNVANSGPQIKEAISRVQLAVLQQVEGAIKYRIFNKGRDASGTRIGKYTPLKTRNQQRTLDKIKRSKARAKLVGRKNNLSPYMRKRVAAGRQVSYVDLEFTGGLRDSIVRGTQGGKQVIGFANQGAYEIAGYLEEFYKNSIFTPTKKEMKDALALFADLMGKELQKIIKTWS